MEAKIKIKPAFSVLGLVKRGDANSGPEWIPPIWNELFNRYGEIIKQSGPGYGVMDHFDKETNTFEYLAGFEAQPGAKPPEGLTMWEIPEQTYAVIRCTIRTIGDAYTFFYREWLPKVDYERGEGAEFELYAEEFQGGDDDPMYVYLPIKKGEPCGPACIYPHLKSSCTTKDIAGVEYDSLKSHKAQA